MTAPGPVIADAAARELFRPRRTAATRPLDPRGSLDVLLDRATRRRLALALHTIYGDADGQRGWVAVVEGCTGTARSPQAAVSQAMGAWNKAHRPARKKLSASTGRRM